MLPPTQARARHAGEALGDRGRTQSRFTRLGVGLQRAGRFIHPIQSEYPFSQLEEGPAANGPNPTFLVHLLNFVP